MKNFNIMPLALRFVWQGINVPIGWAMCVGAIVLLVRVSAMATVLNDTGITTYGDASSNDLANEPVDYPGQDASHGRDAAARLGILAKVGGGNAGFDFSKIDANGQTLSNDAVTWSCVRDNVTGLVWEVKTDDGGLHDQAWTYTWYNSTGVNDGGSAGAAGLAGSCGDTVGGGCDTEKFVEAVNASGLCGATDWRLPSRIELMTIVDNSRINPTIDINYFPNTFGSHYWSSSPAMWDMSYFNYAWSVMFGYGDVGAGDAKSDSIYVRLVRGGR